MTQPKDFFVKKYHALKGIKYTLAMIINEADRQAEYEKLTADDPDTAVYTKTIAHLTHEIMRINHTLANVERKMHE